MQGVPSLTALILVLTLVLVPAKPVLGLSPPGPSAPAEMDPGARNIPPDIRASLARDPGAGLPLLARHLTGDARDDFHKVRRIHDWIADNLAYSSNPPRRGRGPAGAADVLASGAGNCQAYSTLFDALCSLAGIRSATISGYARGFGYDPAAPENPLLANHAWNAVFLDGGWRLVDVTWDAGCLDSAGVFSRRYSTAFLFPEPGKFLYTHLPTEPGWQLLDPPATPEQFAGRPYLRGEFHAMGLSLAEPVARINPAGREAVLVLDVPNDVRILAREQSVLGAAAPPESTFIRREKNRVSILATFPRPGRWKLKIFARRLSEPDHGLVAVVAYDATEWGEHRYPYRYQAYSSLKCSLVGPLSASLTPNQKSSFSIRVPGVAAVSLLLDDEQWVLMNRAGPDLFCATATVPESGDVKILVKPTLGDNEWIGLVRYP